MVRFWKLHTVLGIMLLSLCSHSFASAQELQGIVVWKLEAKSGVEQKDIDLISGYLTGQVEAVSNREVISESDINTILRGEEARQRCGVDDASCMAEIGNALGVPEAISGELGRLGAIWMLNLRRINVRNAKVVKRVGRQIEGPVEDLVKSIPDAVAELFRMEAASTKQTTVEETPMKTSVEYNKAELSVMAKAGWGCFGAGLIVGLAAVSAHVAASIVQENYDNSPTSEERDIYNNSRYVAISCYAVGSALVVTGAALLIVDAVRPKDNESLTAFIPNVATDGDSLAVSWNWQW